MTGELSQSIREVAAAIDRLNQVFESHVDEMRSRVDPDEYRQWLQRKSAMRDSGMLYLTWAKHYARVMTPEGSELEMSEDELF